MVVNNDKKASHFDKVEKKASHFDTHKTHAYRPDVKTTIMVSRHDSHKKVVAKVENMKGVMDTNWNPRTRELTVRYDANKTSARNIKDCARYGHHTFSFVNLYTARVGRTTNNSNATSTTAYDPK